MPVVKQDIMHFPKFAFLGGGHRGLACLQTALVNFCQWKMAKIETHFALEFFHNLLNNFMRLGTILILVFPEFHQGYRRCIRTNEYVPWFNDLYDLFLKSHNIYSFKFFSL